MTTFQTPIGNIKRAIPQNARILQIPDESKIQFRSSEEDFEASSVLINDQISDESELDNQVLHQNVEVSSEDIKQKMAEFSNRPLPPGSKVLSPEEFNKYQKVKEQIKEKSKELTPTRRERVSAILGIGRKNDFIEVDGNQFHIHSLKDKEEKEILSYLYEMTKNKFIKNDVEYAKETQLLYLAFALEKIIQSNKSEILFSDLVLESFNENTIETRIALLSEFDYNSVTLPLYQKFNEMKSGLTIKDKQDAQNVVDDIKK